MTEQLPQTGIGMATTYIHRQFWRMKWITLGISGTMMTYSINSKLWVPLLPFNNYTWTFFLILYFVYTWQINKQFRQHAKNLKANKESEPKLLNGIQMNAWFLWGISVIMIYWTITSLYISFLS